MFKDDGKVSNRDQREEITIRDQSRIVYNEEGKGCSNREWSESHPRVHFILINIYSLSLQSHDLKNSKASLRKRKGIGNLLPERGNAWCVSCCFSAIERPCSALIVVAVTRLPPISSQLE